MPVLHTINDAIQPLSYCTNNRAGSRFSDGPNPDLLVGPNVPDTWLDVNVWRCSNHDGRTNLVPSNMSSWVRSDDGGHTPTPIVTDQGNGVWRIQLEVTAGSTWGSVVTYNFSGTPISGAQGFNGFQYRIISGDATYLQMKYASGSPGNDAITEFIADGQWHEAKGYPITGRTRCEFQLPGIWDGGSGIVTVLVLEIKRMRTVDADRWCPAFADYTAAGESFGTDRLSVPDPGMNALSEIAFNFAATDYGTNASSGLTRPNSGARGFNFSGTDQLQVRLSGSVADSWFLDGTVNTAFTGNVVDGEQLFIFANWDGTNVYAEGVPGNTVSAADPIAPLGTLHLFNNSAGTRPIPTRNGSIFLYVDSHLTTEQRIDHVNNVNKIVAPGAGVIRGVLRGVLGGTLRGTLLTGR